MTMASANEQSALIAQLNSDEFHLLETMGGWRGILESTIPVLVFLTGFTISGDLWLTAGIAAGVSITFIVARLAAKESVTQAFGGVLTLVIGLVWTLWSGREENFFAFGLLIASLFFLILTLSNLVARPAVGVALGMAWALPEGWMSSGEYTAFFRACAAVTWLWAGIFAFRLIVQVPFWWGGYFEALATAKLIQGLPLLALGGWISWMILRPYSSLSATGASNNAATSSMTEADGSATKNSSSSPARKISS